MLNSRRFQIFVLTFNIHLLFSAVAFLTAGICLKVEFEGISHGHINYVRHLWIFIGSFTLLYVFFGSYGAYYKLPGYFLIYILSFGFFIVAIPVIMIVIGDFQFLGSIFAYGDSPDYMRKTVKNDNDAELIKHDFAAIQENFRCCGENSFKDYINSHWKSNRRLFRKYVPESCCNIYAHKDEISSNMSKMQNNEMLCQRAFSQEYMDFNPTQFKQFLRNNSCYKVMSRIDDNIMECQKAASYKTMDSNYLYTKGCYKVLYSWSVENKIACIILIGLLGIQVVVWVIIIYLKKAVIEDEVEADNKKEKDEADKKKKKDEAVKKKEKDEAVKKAVIEDEDVKDEAVKKAVIDDEDVKDEAGKKAVIEDEDGKDEAVKKKEKDPLQRCTDYIFYIMNDDDEEFDKKKEKVEITQGCNLSENKEDKVQNTEEK